VQEFRTRPAGRPPVRSGYSTVRARRGHYSGHGGRARATGPPRRTVRLSVTPARPGEGVPGLSTLDRECLVKRSLAVHLVEKSRKGRGYSVAGDLRLFGSPTGVDRVGSLARACLRFLALLQNPIPAVPLCRAMEVIRACRERPSPDPGVWKSWPLNAARKCSPAVPQQGGLRGPDRRAAAGEGRPETLLTSTSDYRLRGDRRASTLPSGIPARRRGFRRRASGTHLPLPRPSVISAVPRTT
jgi:hypothetical protein